MWLLALVRTILPAGRLATGCTVMVLPTTPDPATAPAKVTLPLAPWDPKNVLHDELALLRVLQINSQRAPPGTEATRLAELVCTANAPELLFRITIENPTVIPRVASGSRTVCADPPVNSSIGGLLISRVVVPPVVV